jgi:4-amino-4-deoxy-L-arabinose transferase-like glycosyltransferase
MFSSVRTMSATCDEVAHLPAGYSYLAFGDFRLNPEHPPLAKALGAVPLILANEATAIRSAESWRLASLQPSREWRFGHDFLYATPGNDADALLLHARAAMMIIPLLLAALLWLWASDLWGELAGAATLLVWCFEPNLLAHGPLVTTDVALATFAFGACYMLWRTCRTLTLGNTLGLMIFVALAFLSKYSAVFLAPVLLMVLTGRVVIRGTWPARFRGITTTLGRQTRKAAAACVLLLLVGASTWLATWATFGFRYAAARNSTDRFPLNVELANLQVRGGQPGGWQASLAAPFLAAAASHKLLPEAVIYGFASMLRDAQNHQTYLLGNIYQTGRWYYFLVAILVKTPLPILLLATWGMVGLVRRQAGRRPGTADQAAVFVAPLIFLAIAMASHLNLGVRHVLPLYPYVLLLAGSGAATLAERRRPGSTVLLAVLSVWLTVGVARVYPHFLSYFNEVAGGPRHGLHWLVDSNLDWGQDLPGLRRWMQDHDVLRVNLCYFGNADPTHYGIDFVALPGSWGVWDGRSPASPQIPGYLAISATNLAGSGLQTPELRGYYRRLLKRATLVDTVGYSIYIFSLTGR